MVFQIDIKVYGSVQEQELPLRMPDSVLRNSYDGDSSGLGHAYSKKYLRRGYISPIVNCTEAEIEAFEEWALTRGGDIKVLGSIEIKELTL